MPLSRTPDARTRGADSWQRLAGIRLCVPGRGNVTVAEMLEQVSASGADPTTRNELARELGNLAALLEPLPPAARDEIIECISDTIREVYERSDWPSELFAHIKRG
jgi:hypothetical protein